MKLTQETDYAFRIVLYLTKRKGEVVEAEVISDAEKVPKRFLLKICRKLNQAGIIESFRGKNGGYRLARDPQEVTLKDVIEIIEGSVVVSKCQENPTVCSKDATGYCSIHRVLNQVQSLISSEFAKHNFASLAKCEVCTDVLKDLE